MKKSSVVSTLSKFVLLSIVFLLNNANAADLDWSGIYRFEANSIKNSELNSRDREKNYALHHLVLKPKIVASDGLIIYSRFDIFNSDNPAYANSQMGEIFGGGVRTGSKAATTNSNNSNALSENQKNEDIQVSHLYLTYIHEFGSLVAGRAPLHFGLGMTHNAGNGLFDHWLDNRDMVGYKMVLGNLYFFPIFAKLSESALHRNEDIDEYLFHLQYENPETELEMGFIYQIRKSNVLANDAPAGSKNGEGEVLGGAGSVGKGVDLQNFNFYARKDTRDFKIAVEAGFQNGKSGVLTSDGQNVNFNSFGIAGEFEYRPEASDWKYGINAGVASGDDPETDDKFEGFIFDRNYDVAFLFFNHPLGMADFFRTALVGGGNSMDPGVSEVAASTTDTEAISNVMYFSPYAHYRWTDKLRLETSLTTGWLSQEPFVSGDTDKSIGYEWDIGLNYIPREGVNWVTQIGFLFPGSAFEGGGAFDSKFAYGLTTKAAISF